MRAINEIDDDEYNELRVKYTQELLNLNNIKQRYLSIRDEVINFEEFHKKIYDVIFKDEESIFRIFCSIINTILVEKIDNKVMLHFKLNITINIILNLNDFLLLFNNNKRCCSSNR